MKQTSVLGRAIARTDECVCKPQLTSLVDVMTILLVFLLKSFSVEGTIVTPAKDLQLPASISNETPKPLPAIQITNKGVLIESTMLASMKELTESDSMLIPKLYSWLSLQSGWIGTTREIMIQSDRNAQFSIIKKVMYTCSKAGIADFTVLVLNEA
jgi:biopolymer transport protein ExbD